MTEFYCQSLRSFITHVLCIRRQGSKCNQYGHGKYGMCKNCATGKGVIEDNPEAVELAKVRTVRHTHWPRPKPRRAIEAHYYRDPDFGADGDMPYSQVKRKERGKQ